MSTSFRDAMLKPTSSSSRIVTALLLLPLSTWRYVNAPTQEAREDALFGVALGVANLVYALWQS